MVLKRITTSALVWLLARDFGAFRLIKLDSLLSASLFSLFDLGVLAIVLFVEQHLLGSKH